MFIVLFVAMIIFWGSMWFIIVWLDRIISSIIMKRKRERSEYRPYDQEG